MIFNEGLIFSEDKHLYIIKHEDSVYKAEYYYNPYEFVFDNITGSYFKTLEEAIEWCQKDYEERIESGENNE